MHRSLVCLSLLALVGCQSGLGPVTVISGRWTGWGLEHGLTLDLVQHGSAVSGTGSSWAFINPPIADYMIAGTYEFPSVTLTLTSHDTVVSQFTGTVVDGNHMIRVQRFGDFSDTLRLTRHP